MNMEQTIPELMMVEIEVAQKRKRLTSHQVAKKAGMPVSTYYKRLREPESVTLGELGLMSKAVGIKWEAKDGGY